MDYYLCTNGKETRFTIKAENASDALSRAITQFSINGEYHTPILASSMTDPNDYKSSQSLLNEHMLECDAVCTEQQIQAALESLEY